MRKQMKKIRQMSIRSMRYLKRQGIIPAPPYEDYIVFCKKAGIENVYSL